MNFDELTEKRDGEKSTSIRERVMKARDIQEKRYGNDKEIHANAQMSTKRLKHVCELDKPNELLLKKAMERLDLCARAYDKILKVARTVADLSSSKNIKP